MKIRYFLPILLMSCGLIAAPLAQAKSHASTAPRPTFSNKQKQAIQSIVREYLISNPEVLIEASQALQQRQREAMMKKAQDAIAEHIPQLFESSSPVSGNPNGNVTLVEFFDFQCVHCKDMVPIVERLTKANKNLRVVYKHFPIFGDNSEKAARVALYLYKNQPEKYKAFHNAVMGDRSRLNNQKITAIAKSIGMNSAQIKEAMTSTQFDDEIRANGKIAEALGIIGTPAFVIAPNPPKQEMKSFFVPGAASFNMLQNIINDTRNKQSVKPGN